MNKYERFIIYFVLIASVLAYFHFFRFTFVPYSFQVLAQVGVCAVIILLIIFRIIYFPGSHEKMHFSWPIILVTIGTVPSMFVAYFYQNQDFVVSIYANRLLLFYLLYYFLHLYRVPIKIILQVIIITGLFAVFLYYVQLAIYPKLIMKLVSVMETRGTLRLFIPGLLCTMAAYFYFVNKFFETNNLKLLFFSLVALSAFILQGTRVLIFSTLFLTLVNLIISNRIKSKLLMVVTISMASFAVFLIFREIFIAILQVSSNQSENFANDIRIRAAEFFLTDFMPSDIAYLFGNGNPDAGSPYDLKQFYYSFKFGYYLNDIGIVGDYVRYGVIFIIGSIYLLVKALRFKIGTEYKFLKFYIAAQCFTLLTGKGVIGGADIVLICSLYIFDIENARLLKEKSTLKQHDRSNG